MKLDSLLREYGETVTAPIPDFAAVLAEAKRRERKRWMGGLVGLAAAAVVAWMLFVPKTERVVMSEPGGMATPVVAKHVEPEVVTEVLVEKPRVSPVRRRVVPVREAGEFVAIAETKMLPQPQMYQVLRVSVSGERLVALGVLRPNQMMRPTMLADVLLGDDGLARAVRVVGNEY